MQGVTAVHAEHHIHVCGLLCRLVDDVALCLSLICGDYAFRFTCDRRDFILFSSYPTSPELLGRVATVYVVPSHNKGSAKKATGNLQFSLGFSEQETVFWEWGLSRFGSHLAASLSYTPLISAISALSGINSGDFRICIIYNLQDGEFHISSSDQACCVCVRPSRVLLACACSVFFNAG